MNREGRDIEELFDAAYDNRTAGSSLRAHDSTPVVDRLVDTAVHLQNLQFPAHQLEAARTRVGRRVFGEIAQSEPHAHASRLHKVSTPPIPGRTFHGAYRTGALLPPC